MLVTFYLTGPFSATTLSDTFTIVGNPGAETHTGITKTQLLTGHSITFSDSVTGGTVTATNETCEGTQVTWSVSQEPEPTPTSSNELSVYLRDVAGIQASNVVVYYTVNGGSAINLPGATNVTLPISCSFIYAIGGLNNGDIVVIGTNNMYSAAGQPGTNCPSGVGGLSTYTYTYNGGNESIALTFDTSINP